MTWLIRLRSRHNSTPKSCGRWYGRIRKPALTVVRRYDGHIAQHLGDGLLVYFGYPVAHEDDAERAVRAGLEIITAIQKKVSSPSAGKGRGFTSPPSSPHRHSHRVSRDWRDRQQRETRNPGVGRNTEHRGAYPRQANPDEVMISAATYRLVEGLFTCEDRGQPELKGVATPLTLYRVSKESEAHSRFEVVVRKGLTPLIGREHEYGLLHERWERVKDGAGQVVLLSGEPGIGKSRLVEALKETVEHEGCAVWSCAVRRTRRTVHLLRCIEHLQRCCNFGQRTHRKRNCVS